VLQSSEPQHITFTFAFMHTFPDMHHRSTATQKRKDLIDCSAVSPSGMSGALKCGITRTRNGRAENTWDVVMISRNGCAENTWDVVTISITTLLVCVFEQLMGTDQWMSTIQGMSPQNPDTSFISVRRLLTFCVSLDANATRRRAHQKYKT
jgi:hypothetical protein